MPDPYAAAQEAAARLAEATGRSRHDALVVLGSGWEPAADVFGEPEVRLPMSDLPGFRAPVAEGHLDELRSCQVNGVATLVLLGRTHLYEGHGPASVVHGIRTAAAAGVRLAVLTNANGALRGGWSLGQPVLVGDHLNLTAVSPLVGARFVDLTDTWSPRLRTLARSLDPTLEEGVYAMVPGPEYQTAAETQWLRRLGADMVGMSTVLEAIAARDLGVELVGLSTVTEVPDAQAVTDPSEVVATARRTARRLGPLLAELVTKGVQA
ncbi:MAG TPA: purine-nucleoside phosphorylase [Nocardioidaceae bacterium]